MYLRLYVSGSSPQTRSIIATVQAMCTRHFPGAFTLEVLTLEERPGQARDDGVTKTPTLLRIFPSPLRRVVGNLDDAHALLLALRGGRGRRNTPRTRRTAG
jgi:circadian clock protein KaiB